MNTKEYAFLTDLKELLSKYDVIIESQVDDCSYRTFYGLTFYSYPSGFSEGIYIEFPMKDNFIRVKDINEVLKEN